MSTKRNNRRNNSAVRTSKSLSWLLRHGAIKDGCPMRTDGYCKISDVLKSPSVARNKITKEDILEIVSSNDKQRFKVIQINGEDYIRANQGHSLDVQLDLDVVTASSDLPNGIAVHGTYYGAWKLIKESGLNRMNRQHIHMAVDTVGKDSVISGMRSTCQVAVYVDVDAAIEDGFEFFMSENGVVLCAGDETGLLPKKYFSTVIDIKTGNELEY